MQWTLVVGLVFAIMIAIFATVNVEKVPINYVFGKANWPLILVILSSVLAGFIMSFCFSAFRILKNKRATKSLNKEFEQLRVLLNEKNNEIARLKYELTHQGSYVFVKEETPIKNDSV